jgi:DUF1365 family protein
MVGEVQHCRYVPVYHRFCYSLFMPCIDLDELESLQQQVWGFGSRWWHWARFRREDYLGEGDIKQAVQDKLYQLTGERLQGRVLMLCHLRYFGLYFSPVNFYYLYDRAGNWRYLLAEVSNTPWNERHYYAVPAERGSEGNWKQSKAFHVSPFNPMEQEYHWRLKPPGERAFVQLGCHQAGRVFSASLLLKARAFTSANLFRLLAVTPVLTLKVVTGIYWQALKLLLKRAPFYPHSVRRQSNG